MVAEGLHVRFLIFCFPSIARANQAIEKHRTTNIRISSGTSNPIGMSERLRYSWATNPIDNEPRWSYHGRHIRTLPPESEKPPPVPPGLPNLGSLHEVANELRTWINGANEAVGKYRSEVDEWSQQQEQEKDSAFASIEFSIEKKRKEIEKLIQKQEQGREAATKKIEEAQRQLEDWVQTQQKAISEAQATLDGLQMKGFVHHGNTDSSLSMRNPPDELFCPITREIMRDPVVAEDGHTYERTAIGKFWTEKGTPISPVTNRPLPSDRLTPSVTLRSLCRMFSVNE